MLASFETGNAESVPASEKYSDEIANAAATPRSATTAAINLNNTNLLTVKIHLKIANVVINVRPSNTAFDIMNLSVRWMGGFPNAVPARFADAVTTKLKQSPVIIPH